ncbi:site-specific DNA-methyltransferase (adenine-specific) [Arenibacter palladensis]|uniref:Methyltransferase n=1 Tax=Arenibacter palladensis TaxID=237373 RepID=A0A1M4U908_9FLAO|nr:DNA methyltransferase [Arenibacter palladensis]SHE53331.1 site-specific DNA-methyltransferase (adenine-specific) [Arenibacter palladensis]
MDNYLTVSQAADVIGVSSATLRRWDKAGKFESFRHPINNYRVYDEASVNALKTKINQDSISLNKDIKLNDFTPFFQTQRGQLFKIDAIEFLQSLESESVDMIFADPPYNIKKAEWDTFSSQKEYVDWSLRWIKEAHRVLTKNGTLYICGFSEILADLKWASSGLFPGCKWLVWFYRNKGNLGKDWGRSHESILHLRKSKSFTFNIDEIRIPYNEHTTKYPSRKQAESSQFANGKKNKYVWTPNPLGAKPKDVIEIPTISNGSWEKTTHNTQKPVELLRKVILSSSNENDLILDPFGGSGTTFAVAEAYNRRWIGTELELNYCNIIKERLSDREQLHRINSSKDTVESQKRRLKLRG